MSSNTYENNTFQTHLDTRGVATITLNRPDVHNALNEEMIQGLTKQIDEFDKNSKVRLLVLTGTGKSFCAGADLHWMKKMKSFSYQENLADAQKLAKLFSVLNGFSKPTLAKVNGSALGGGAGLLACCDYVIADRQTLFGFTEVRLGLLPATISPYVIAKIGTTHARAHFLSGARFNTDQALNMGLIHQISSEGLLNQETEKQITEFLQAAPIASGLAKDLIFQIQNLNQNQKNSDKVELFTCEQIAQVRASEEGQEGMTALLEKRKPRWDNKC